MGRLDRETRFYLADMLVGFLDRRLPPRRRGAFRGRLCAARPLGRRLRPGAAARSASRSSAGRCTRSRSRRLLAQLFQVTEQFEMETQPQLLLLQKTMVLVEGRRAAARSRASICGRWRGRSSNNGCGTIAAPRRACASALEKFVEMVDGLPDLARARKARRRLVEGGCRDARRDPRRPRRTALARSVLADRPAMAGRRGPCRDRRRAFAQAIAYT